MTARYQLSTPVVPSRETYFARFCKKYSENDWIVVDVSLDRVHQVPVMGCKKRPSGCLIRGLSDGFSQVNYAYNINHIYYVFHLISLIELFFYSCNYVYI